MSKTVDQRVVEMRFDNKNFESNVSQTMSTLDKLKAKLKLDGAAKGLENLDTKANRINLSGLSNAVETIRARFSALEVMGVTALANITNSAVNAGKRIVSALTIDPIKTGFQEYETQINAVQTILANTESKGSTLEDVNKALDELNTYADKTIYNFTEMTRNIGTFTAAGVDLKTSTTAIQGIANLAAVSGSTSQQASTAMYQLSQALASGTVKLQDWNSVVNAGMGGQVFQDALKKTARAHGVAIDDIIEKEGSFRESLSKGWLTADILTETLGKMTQTGAAEYLSKLTGVEQSQIEAAQKLVDTNKDGSASYDEIAEKMAATGKVSKDQAMEILKMADTATNAATKVKTFTQLWDTLQEAAQSGWTQTWEIIVGDFEEAKDLLTNISDVVGDFINKTSEARNKMLQGWKDLGGRKALIEGFKNIFEGILSVLKPIKEAFRDIFPPMTSKKLYDLTVKFKELTAKFTIGEATAKKLRDTFRGLFSIFDLGKKAITAVLKPIFELLTGSTTSSVIDGILSVTASIGRFFTELNKSSSIAKGFSVVGELIAGSFKLIGESVSFILGKFDGIGGVLSKVWSVISTVAGKIQNVLSKVFKWIRENISFGDIFAGLAGGGIFLAFKKLSNLFDSVSGLFEKIGDTFKDFFKMDSNFKEVLGAIKDSLTSFSQGIKVASLVGIAIAVTLLSSSIRKLSELKITDVAIGLVAMKLMIMELSKGFESLCKTLTTYPAKRMLRASISLIAMAEAINILASVIKKLSDVSWGDMTKGLAGIGVSIYALSKSMRYISESKGMITARDSIALIAMATACNILAKALESIGKLSIKEIIKGVGGLTACIAALTASIRVISAGEGKTFLRDSITLIAIANACKTLAKPLMEIGTMRWQDIIKGVGAIGTCIAALTASIRVISAGEGKTLLRDSILIISIASACKTIGNTLMKIGTMRWKDILKGIGGIGACIGALTASIRVISGGKGKTLLRDSILIISIASACKMIGNSLMEIGVMRWQDIVKGLGGVGIALGELTAVTILLGKFGGVSALAGAASILIMSFSLGKIADALMKIGSMSWDEIKRGLTGMGIALVELGVVCGTLGYLTNVAGLVGAGTILLAVQGLDQLANALIKFGSMSWSEIGRGLTAMGAALGEVALGGVLNTLSGLGALSIAALAKPLGDLADSFKKWGTIQYEDIANGLKAMNVAFIEIAAGGMLNTLSGLGSLSIATVAKPLGDLADSVVKWKDVIIPEGLGTQLAELSKAIMKFTFDGLGAEALATAAPGIGQMADSIKKWQDVSIPENLETSLSSIAKGIKEFSFAFMSGWSLSTVTKPLGDLADSIKKWKDVSIPADIEDSLYHIAMGVQEFTYAFMSGWSLSAVVKPLGDLADSIKKWKDITVPKTLETDLKNIASAIKEFSILGALKIASIAEPLNTLGSAFKKFSGLTGDSSNILTVADNIKKCCDKFKNIDSGSIAASSGPLNTLANTVTKINGTNVSNISNFVESVNKLNDIKIKDINVNTGALKSAVNAIKDAMKGMETAIKNSKSSINNAMKTAVSGLDTPVKNTKSKLDSAINSAISSMISKIKGKKGEVTSAFKTLVSGAADGVKNNKQSFVTAGQHLGSGLVQGINSKKTDAYNAGFALGKAAVQGEKAGQQSHSPSKATIKAGKWIGEGLVIGMNKMGQKVTDAGRNMGVNVVDNISHALSLANDILDSDDYGPVIKPVLDLSDVESGAGYLNTMFNNPSIGVMSNLSAISRGMNTKIQNATNDDVVSAINKLSKNLGNVSGDTYNINGVTYDDGSNITEAVSTLIRAANVGRRV